MDIKASEFLQFCLQESHRLHLLTAQLGVLMEMSSDIANIGILLCHLMTELSNSYTPFAPKDKGSSREYSDEQ
jgi:hypothetical protein